MVAERRKCDVQIIGSDAAEAAAGRGVSILLVNSIQSRRHPLRLFPGVRHMNGKTVTQMYARSARTYACIPRPNACGRAFVRVGMSKMGGDYNIGGSDTFRSESKEVFLSSRRGATGLTPALNVRRFERLNAPANKIERGTS
jgi:hypothetical protein